MSVPAKKYKTFVIHLRRAVGRRAQVDDLISKAPYQTQIIDAVDGSKVSQDEIDAHYSSHSLAYPAYPFELNVGEIGCFLSHRKVWQEIISQGLDGALIFEDDVQINAEEFGNAYRLAQENVEIFGYIQFQVRNIKDGNTILAKSGETKIIRPNVTILRTSGQFVSNAVAKKLLELTKKFDRPIDTTLQMHWNTGLHLAAVVPSGITDRTQETGGSTLSKKQQIGQKIYKEYARFMYRSKVAKLSKY